MALNGLSHMREAVVEVCRTSCSGWQGQRVELSGISRKLWQCGPAPDEPQVECQGRTRVSLGCAWQSCVDWASGSCNQTAWCIHGPTPFGLVPTKARFQRCGPCFRWASELRQRAWQDHINVDPLLAKITQQSLIDLPADIKQESWRRPRDERQLAVSFLVYSKTGRNFVRFFLSQVSGPHLGHKGCWSTREVLSRRLQLPQISRLPVVKPYCKLRRIHILPWSKPHVIRVSTHGPTSAVIRPMPANSRMVHMYRDPARWIVSYFRYLSGIQSVFHENPAWHTVTSLALNAEELSLRSLQDLPAACRGLCTFYDLLNAVAPEAGVLLTSRVIRAEVQLMAKVFKKTANDPRVLHLSVDHLHLNYYKTMRCMLRFLRCTGHPVSGSCNQLVGTLRKRGLAPTDDGSDIRAHARYRRHATFNKHNNSRLRALVMSVPAWAPGLARFRSLAASTSKRQAALFGCPLRLPP
ncbi:unnamed protein product [Symbiodinium natans]|uniref:Sulfotransferase domain-containing protein n=1 Tax=Symbiodinium natans TaxID=878477 RepID=A0A812R043_9DINO|nr:unnamed protein product [Symbiodinium natans]